ncbi:MAG: hypothetical protein A07HN63_02448, partial [uncultured archaeon A07HN63]
MEYPLFHIGFVLLLAGTQGIFSMLAVLNVRHAERLLDREQAWVKDALGVDGLDELRDYHRLTSAFSELQSWIGLGVLLLVVYAGGLSWAVDVLAATGQPVVVQGIAFFVALAVAAQLFAVPFDLVSTFGVEDIFRVQQSDTAAVRPRHAGPAWSLYRLRCGPRRCGSR